MDYIKEQTHSKGTQRAFARGGSWLFRVSKRGVRLTHM
jgi:hypothetical protein